MRKKLHFSLKIYSCINEQRSIFLLVWILAQKSLSVIEVYSNSNSIWEIFFYSGDHVHNKETMANGFGTLVVGRSPGDEDLAEPKQYGPCKECFVWVHLEQLTRHLRDCDFKPLNAKKEKPSELKRASQKMISCAIESSNIRTELDKHVENVLLSLSGDRIGEIIKKDELIIAFCRDR